ncbi:NB-ARC domain, LRR domain containing protein [Trema orientale]|uniref:NB-ARC domain, LRR domain containing protein n=1 Tax=Trema orientale TaxID=63057 RepID=A0A2P5CGS9_TREOI|nr:NB-ARC domain, LRR domain containing protein [Trema orientale]
MAETVVGLVVDKLIPLLTEEAKLLKGVHKEVDVIRHELQSILAFLKDADRRAETEGDTISDGVRLWVKDLREVAFQIEDVTDEYTLHIAQWRQQKQQRSLRLRFIRLLHKGACFVAKLKPRHDIASKIQELKQTVQEIKGRSAPYGFNSTQQAPTTASQNSKWYGPRNDHHFLKETEVVGIESARDELIAKLEGGSPRRTVISLVGTGGLGKTTLAHQVYIRAKELNFDRHAWVEVSPSYNKVELLRNLIKEFCQARKESVPERIDEMDELKVTTKIREYLQGKSYLIIFDDVWNINFWGDIKNALPEDNDKNARIVITTRDVKVANFCKTSSVVHIHELQPMPMEDAWELFRKKAFHSEPEENCPAELENLSREILKRCDGLPLAIVVIAGLLSTKGNSVDEWRNLLTSLSSELESNEHLKSIPKIMSLSYNDLPYHLKSCFLYFGIFPKDYSIPPERLFQQWIAEGFVKPRKDKTLEAIAEEYLVELINRSMVQVTEVGYDGKAESCSVHDLMREIILQKMDDLSFCQVLSGTDSNFRGSTRRISILNSSHDAFESCGELSHVRSVFVFDKDESINYFVSIITKNCKLLKVLYFEGDPSLDHLPEDIGDLFHLRYLSVRGTRVKVLPKSIGKLENLETLNLEKSLVYELTFEISRLRKLRNLIGYQLDENQDFHIDSLRGLKIKNGIGCSKALQQLYCIEANVNLFKELNNLTQMRTLGITKLKNEDGRKLCDSIQKMKQLEFLQVASVSEDETLSLEDLSSPPQFLRQLFLYGHLRTLPEWITKLQNLVEVSIRWSKLEEDPMEALQKLRNLLKLGIDNDAYNGDKLHFKEGAFPKLKELSLCTLSKLQLVVIEEGALRNLEVFAVGPCPQLQELPSGFKHLRNIKEFSLNEMPMNFLMSQNFESLQTETDHIWLSHKIRGNSWALRLDWIMETLKSTPGKSCLHLIFSY